MQWEKASGWAIDDWELVDPPAFDEPDDEAGCMAVEPSCAT
jgi:hypothetical protein